MSVRKDEIHVATLRELAEAHVEIARLTKALDEREADMHMRIRAGYDKTVADAWRAEVEKRDAEIARLTAELGAARAVTAGVCRYLDCAASDLLAVVTSLYETRARAISDATAARGTVGGLLATACEGEIVEFDEGSWWMQITVFGSIARWRVHDADDGWHPYVDDPSSWHCDEFVAFWLSKPARLVSAAEADADPNQRGPLPKGG